LTRLARAVFIVLVGATVAAFFTAQRLKGEPAVAQVRGLVHVFSPNGDHFKDVNRFVVEQDYDLAITVNDLVQTCLEVAGKRLGAQGGPVPRGGRENHQNDGQDRHCEGAPLHHSSIDLQSLMNQFPGLRPGHSHYKQASEKFERIS